MTYCSVFGHVLCGVAFEGREGVIFGVFLLLLLQQHLVVVVVVDHFTNVGKSYD